MRKITLLILLFTLIFLFGCEITEEKGEGSLADKIVDEEPTEIEEPKEPLDDAIYYMVIEGGSDEFFDFQELVIESKQDYLNLQNQLKNENYQIVSEDLLMIEDIDFSLNSVVVLKATGSGEHYHFLCNDLTIINNTSELVLSGTIIHTTYTEEQLLKLEDKPELQECLIFLLLKKDEVNLPLNNQILYLTLVLPDELQPIEVEEPILVYKPVIYLMSDEELDLTIRFANPERLVTTYPKYQDGWHIHLKQGDLIDESNRHYYALFYDEISNYHCLFNEGFYVEKANAISFLEEKLAYLGFTEREANEMIMFWLPILEQNEKSIVYFEQTEERNEECPLIFSVEPDTMLRVIMHVKKVDEKVQIKEQTLLPFTRFGFTLVEWGGTNQ